MVNWYWYEDSFGNSTSPKYFQVPESDAISLESEYQEKLKSKRVSRRVYRCFGDGVLAIFDSYNMMTRSCFEDGSIKDNFGGKTYRLRRGEECIWEWEDPNTSKYVKVPDHDANCLEHEYQKELAGKRKSQIVYHCFGDGGSAQFCFRDTDNMSTDCASSRCLFSHKNRNMPSNHMAYKLRRTPSQL